MKKNFFISVFLFFSLCIFSQELISADEKILSLNEIDVLIKDTNYDKALVELNKFIIAYPNSFDSAQMRIRKIMKARNSYSNLADKLFGVILENPDDNDSIFNLTQQLKILERHPSDVRLKFFKDIEVAAEFNYYRVQFNKVQEESSKLASEGKFVYSVLKSRSGFYMYKDSFLEEFKDTKTLTEVEEKTETAKEYLEIINTSDNDNEIKYFEGLLREMWKTEIDKSSEYYFYNLCNYDRSQHYWWDKYLKEQTKEMFRTNKQEDDDVFNW